MAESLLVSGLGAGNLLVISPILLLGGAGSAQAVALSSTLLTTGYGRPDVRSAEVNLVFTSLRTLLIAPLPLPFAGPAMFGPVNIAVAYASVGYPQLENTNKEFAVVGIPPFDVSSFFVSPSIDLTLSSPSTTSNGVVPLPFAGSRVYAIESRGDGEVSYGAQVLEVPTLLQRVYPTGALPPILPLHFAGPQDDFAFSAPLPTYSPLLPIPFAGGEAHRIEAWVGTSSTFGEATVLRGAQDAAFAGLYSWGAGVPTTAAFAFSLPYAADLRFEEPLAVIPATSVPINVNRPPTIRFEGRSFAQISYPNIGLRHRTVPMVGADPAGIGVFSVDGSTRRVLANPIPPALAFGSHRIGDARRLLVFSSLLSASYGEHSVTEPVRSCIIGGYDALTIGGLIVTRGSRSLTFVGASYLQFGGTHLAYALYISVIPLYNGGFGEGRIINGALLTFTGVDQSGVGTIGIRTIQRVVMRNFDGAITPRPTVYNLRRVVGVYGVYTLGVDTYHAIVNANRAVGLNPFPSVGYGSHELRNLAAAFRVGGGTYTEYGTNRVSYKHRTLSVGGLTTAYMNPYINIYNSARAIALTGVSSPSVTAPTRIANLNRFVRMYSADGTVTAGGHWLSYRQRYIHASGRTHDAYGYSDIRYNPYPVRIPSLGDTSVRGAHALIPINRVIRPTPANAHSPRWAGAFFVLNRNRTLVLQGLSAFDATLSPWVYNLRQYLRGAGASALATGSHVVAFRNRRVIMGTLRSDRYGAASLLGGVVTPTRCVLEFNDPLLSFQAGVLIVVTNTLYMRGVEGFGSGVGAISNPRLVMGGDNRFLEFGGHTFLGGLQLARFTSTDPQEPPLFRTSPYTIYAPSADTATAQARANLPPMEAHPAGLPAPFIPGTGAGGFLPEAHRVTLRNRRVQMHGSDPTQHVVLRVELDNRRIVFRGRNYMSAGWWTVDTPHPLYIAFEEDHSVDMASLPEFVVERRDYVRYVQFIGTDVQVGALAVMNQNRAVQVFAVEDGDGFVTGRPALGTRRWFDIAFEYDAAVVGTHEVQHQHRSLTMRGAEPPPQRSPRSVPRIYETRVPIRFAGITGAIGASSVTFALQHVSVNGVVGQVGLHHIALYAQNTVFYGGSYFGAGNFRRYQPIRFPASTHEDAIGAAVISLVTPGCGCAC